MARRAKDPTTRHRSMPRKWNRRTISDAHSRVRKSPGLNYSNLPLSAMSSAMTSAITSTSSAMAFDHALMPTKPALRVSRACASPSIILESRSAKTRAHKLFSGALAMKIASFDGSSDGSFRELLELVVLQPVERQRPSPRLTPPAPHLGSLPTCSAAD